MNFLVRWSVLSAVALPATVMCQEIDDAGLELGTPAIVVERKAPVYPRPELERGRQGWVQVNYVIGTDGRVVDPVIEDSSGSRFFEGAALRSMENWRFEPATWNGEPVEQCHTQAMITFVIDPTPIGGSRKFVRRYRDINELLNEGKLDEAESLIDEMSDKWKLTVYEVSRTWMLRGLLAGKQGNDALQLKSFRRAAASKGRWIEEDVYRALLERIVALELKARDISAALRAFQALRAAGGEGEMFDRLEEVIARVRDNISSDQLLAVPATLTAARQCEFCEADWQHTLLRRQFEFHEVEGKLGKMEIRCDYQRVVDEAREGVSWKLPESWGDCNVIVFGEADTKFTLLEHPTST